MKTSEGISREVNERGISLQMQRKSAFLSEVRAAVQDTTHVSRRSKLISAAILRCLFRNDSILS